MLSKEVKRAKENSVLTPGKLSSIKIPTRYTYPQDYRSLDDRECKESACAKKEKTRLLPINKDSRRG